MGLSNKHFDDLDDFSAFDEKLECSDDVESSEAGPNSALAWRKVLIERAVTNVRKAIESKTDIKMSYKAGALVFDEASHKFGRVVESRPGFLNVTLLGGGKLVKQDFDPLDFIRKNRMKLTLSEMAVELVMTEVQVIGLLNQIELDNEKQSPKPVSKPKIIAQVKSVAPKKPVLSPIKAIPAKVSPSKVPMKIAAKKSSTPPNNAKKAKISLSSVSKEMPVSFAKLLPKGATTDPVRDPNGYIQQNFLMMSNKELAGATGLSEHTVRRKLGEWGLKRKDFVNKA